MLSIPRWRRNDMLGPGNMGTTTGYTVELQTKVHTKVRNHGEGLQGPSPGSWLKAPTFSRLHLRHYAK